MKYRFLYALIAIGSLFLAGCASPYPKYSDAASHFPPLQRGDGRFIIYSVDPNLGGYILTIKIDGKTAGKVGTGYALYFDRSAGDRVVTVRRGAIGAAGKTVVNLVDGQTQYYQVKEGGIILSHYLIIPTDDDQALGQLDQCRYFDKNFLQPP